MNTTKVRATPEIMNLFPPKFGPAAKSPPPVAISTVAYSVMNPDDLLPVRRLAMFVECEGGHCSAKLVEVVTEKPNEEHIQE